MSDNTECDNCNAQAVEYYGAIGCVCHNCRHLYRTGENGWEVAGPDVDGWVGLKNFQTRQNLSPAF